MEDTDLDGLSDWSQISNPKKRSDDIAKTMPEPNNEDDENGYPRVKQENGIFKAQEAAKILKKNFALSSGDDDDE